MFKVERNVDAEQIVLLISGRMQAQHIAELQAEDLVDLRLIVRFVVLFLCNFERSGVELRNCPWFIREWMFQEIRKQKDAE